MKVKLLHQNRLNVDIRKIHLEFTIQKMSNTIVSIQRCEEIILFCTDQSSKSSIIVLGSSSSENVDNHTLHHYKSSWFLTLKPN